jgi:hypothetical protein
LLATDYMSFATEILCLLFSIPLHLRSEIFGDYNSDKAGIRRYEVSIPSGLDHDPRISVHRPLSKPNHRTTSSLRPSAKSTNVFQLLEVPADVM